VSFPAFIARRLALLALTLVLVPSLSFVMFTLIQGDHTAPLDVLEQLGSYLAAVFLQGELGGGAFRNETFIRTRSALDVVMEGFLVDLYLLAGAIVLAVVIGLAAGTLQATHPRSPASRAIGALTALALSAPVYWLGLVALYLFDDSIGRFPLLPGSGAYQQATSIFGKAEALIMPWCVLAAAFAAIYARFLRGNLIDTMQEDYIRTARAKGVSERRVTFRHGVRAAITPIVTLLGLDIGLLLGGAILTETVFNIQGIGRYAYDAIVRFDLPVIQGTVLFGAFFIVIMSLIVDILYAFVDPRVRY
jgi:peptide/nickel transport system permease protein